MAKAKTQRVSKKALLEFYNEIVSYWNKYTPVLIYVSSSKTVPSSLAKFIRQLFLIEKDNPGYWQGVVDRVASSWHYSGQGRSSWRATFEWTVKNHERINNNLEVRNDVMLKIAKKVIDLEIEDPETARETYEKFQYKAMQGRFRKDKDGSPLVVHVNRDNSLYNLVLQVSDMTVSRVSDFSDFIVNCFGNNFVSDCDIQSKAYVVFQTGCYGLFRGIREKSIIRAIQYLLEAYIDNFFLFRGNRLAEDIEAVFSLITACGTDITDEYLMDVVEYCRYTWHLNHGDLKGYPYNRHSPLWYNYRVPETTMKIKKIEISEKEAQRIIDWAMGGVNNNNEKKKKKKKKMMDILIRHRREDICNGC